MELGVEFLQSAPAALVIVMTGTILPPEEEALCEEHNFPVLRKPFLASDVMNQIRGRRRGSRVEAENRADAAAAHELADPGTNRARPDGGVRLWVVPLPGLGSYSVARTNHADLSVPRAGLSRRREVP